MSNTLTFSKSAPKPTLLIGQLDGLLSGAAPKPTLVARIGYHGITGSAPAPTLVAVMSSPGINDSTVALTAPAPALVATGFGGEILTATLRASVPALVAAVTNPAFITAVLTTPAPRLVAAVLSGNVLAAALAAPAPSLIAAGYPASTMSAALVAPAPRLEAVLGAALAASYRTWVLNTRKGALTEYDGFSFNSFAQFNGAVLACGPSGIVVLGVQDVDGATEIDARVRTGQESFESSMHKRVPRIYTSGAFAGDVIFRTIVEGGTRSYRLPFNSITRLQQRRVPVGRGPRSRFWQFEIANEDGADFSLNDVLVYPVTLRRRVQ